MKELIPQIPAEGVTKTNEWGDSKWYAIRCDCGDTACEHNLEVEADDIGVNVTLYLRVHTKWWSKGRFKQIWQILTKGYAEMETTIIMNEQTALNYAETMKKAIADTQEFKQNRK